MCPIHNFTKPTASNTLELASLKVIFLDLFNTLNETVFDKGAATVDTE